VPAKILLVDDDQNHLEALTVYLHLEGFVVGQAHDGFEALRRLDQETFDIVVSDIRMPRLNGVDLAKRIRSKLQNIPIVLMTGDPGWAATDAIKESDVICLLTKPFVPDELVKIIRTAFDEREL